MVSCFDITGFFPGAKIPPAMAFGFVPCSKALDGRTIEQ
jgi:hypothetical protein